MRTPCKTTLSTTANWYSGTEHSSDSPMTAMFL
jgi:hypothetical protein